MAGRVRSYADVVASALGGPGDPRVAELLAAADALDTALAAPATLTAALGRWRAATDALHDRLVDYLLANVPVGALPAPPGVPWGSPAGITIDASLGPLAVHVNGPTLLVADPSSPGAAPIVIGPQPPNAVQAHLDAGPISGDGGLTILPDGVNGALALHLGAVEVAALASLRHVDGQGSFLAVMAAGFTPGIQFGFGFQLSRIGGLIGINRGFDTDALAARLRDGSAGEALFPLDAGDGARRALVAIEAILPPRLGSSVAGPTLRLSWLEIAGVGFCSLDLGVFVELPGPQRIVIVGIARAGIPPILKLRIDVVGIIDFQRRLLSIDASLVDSGLLGIFTICGDVAFRQSWGDPAYTVVSVGGFYPGFRPEPAQIPPMRRLGFHLDLPVPGIEIRADGYFAVTSNTIQLGGHFEAGISAAGCGAHGFLDVDAIVQFSPFKVHAEVSAGFEVEVFGLTFGGVRLDGILDGPGPVTIHGRLTVETFLKDFHFDETFTFGSGGGTPEVPPQRAIEVLRTSEVVAHNVRAVGGTDRDVVLDPLPVPPDFALVHPRGGVVWQQHRVPLTIPIDRLDGAPLGSMQRVTATVPEQTGGVDDRFAPGSFITLHSTGEAISRPAFEHLPAGVISSGGVDVFGGNKPQRTTPVEFRKVRAEPWAKLAVGILPFLDHPGGVLSMLAARDAHPVVATTAPLVTVGPEAWVSVADGAVHSSATAAHQNARLVGAFAVSQADLAAPVALGGAVMAEFVAWQRPSMAKLATDPPASSRLLAKLPVRLQDDVGAVTGDADFLLAGPADVTAIVPTQIVGRRPHPGVIDAEATMMAHVELAAADLPWRYSPVPFAAGAAGVRPWLVLVVGLPGEVELLGGGRVRLTGAELFAQHPLAAAHRWAHVHDVGGRRFARVVSPRLLTTAQDYVAVLVPGWQATVAADGSTALVDSWPSPSGVVVLPCFDHWTFRTTADPGDFASIAQRLDPLTPAEAAELRARRFGRAAVGVEPFAPDPLAAGGALTVVPEPGDDPIFDGLPEPVAVAVGALAGNVEQDGRWVLTLPRYDAPWHPGPVDGEPWQWPPPGDDVPPDGWRRELRVDPRHRGAAGLGAWAAIEWQDRISDGAARQAAAVAAAAQRIRHLAIGLGAARSLWRRRVPAEPLARLATLSPLMGRMPTDRGGNALDAIDGRTPALSRALFSSAARRMLRRRGPLARSAAPGATALGGLIEAANVCPPPQPIPDEDAKAIDVLNDRDALQALAEAARKRVFEVVAALGDEHVARDAAGSIDGEQQAIDLLVDLREPPPVDTCFPLTDLGAFAGSIAAGVDPTVERPVVVDRVIGAITGLRPPLLAEPDVAPELDIPLWKFLSERSPDWLLPGAGDVPDDRVLAVQTNPAFIDALLVGANHQTLGELRWRNIPITTRWTPLRRFWQRTSVDGGKPLPDIASVVRLSDDADIWTDASMLGDVGHLADPDHGSSLVIVLHTELFRRYPATIVYLTENAGGAATWGAVPRVDELPALHREYPSFSGTLTPELVFFGFDVPPAAGADHWLVLEEPPPGFRFRHPQATDPDTPPTPAELDRRAIALAAADGATFAEATFAAPNRVFFGNLL